MENFDLDLFNVVDEIYPTRDIESNYFDTFTLVYNLEQKTFPVEILNDELFSKTKIGMYSSLNLDSIDTFTLRLNELSSIIDFKDYYIFFLHCAFYFQSIKIIESIKISLFFF